MSEAEFSSFGDLFLPNSVCVSLLLLRTQVQLLTAEVTIVIAHLNQFLLPAERKRKQKPAHATCTLLSFGRKFEHTSKEGNIVLQKLPSSEDQESRTAGHTAGTPTCQCRHSYHILDTKISKSVSN